MKKENRLLVDFVFGTIFLCAAVCMPVFSASAALNLTGTTTIEKNAETAAAAKTLALADARRELLYMVSARYADGELVKKVAGEMSGLEIENLISSTSIENEKTSPTAYSATVSITFDEGALEKWMAMNNIANYIQEANSTGDKITVMLEFNGGLRDWVRFMQGIRASGMSDGLDFSVKTIFGPNVTAFISAAEQKQFVAAVKNMGWNVYDQNGILRVKS